MMYDDMVILPIEDLEVIASSKASSSKAPLVAAGVAIGVGVLNFLAIRKLKKENKKLRKEVESQKSDE